ncbi:MAG: MXAN_5808 family serine peptidase [bacterium]|nr:MXAN_5808 family serine peptidase [bacterium]
MGSTFYRRLVVSTIGILLAGAVGLGLSLSAAAQVQDDQGATTVAPEVIRYVAESYVEPSRIRPAEQLEAALIALERAVPEVLVDWKPGEEELTLRVDKSTHRVAIPPLRSIVDIIPVMRRVSRIVRTNMVSDLEWPRVDYANVNGLLQSLDPHSVLLSPAINKEFRLSAQGSFGGLGIVIGIRDGELTVIAPLEGTPAYRAGIRSKDTIVQIENESTVNMDLIEAVGKLRGDPGTSVTIGIMREGLAEPKEITIVREIINIHSVEAYALGNGVGYITIRNFQENTLRDLNEALRTFHKEGTIRGLVLDLRNNPGGLFDQAVAVADKFIDGGTIVITVGANNTYRKPTYARGWRTEGHIPLVVLINHGSASASEIVSGALKYRRRAILVGTQTFGKGSVQQIFDLADGSALKLSIAQYLLPGDRSIQSVGVSPDLLLTPVELPSNSDDREVRFEAVRRGKKERDLERTFAEWASTAAEPPMFRLSYLKERESEEVRTAMELSRKEKRERLESDFTVQLAKRILLGTPDASRRSLLETAAEVVHQTAEKEEGRITAAIDKLGVDWSRPGSARLEQPRQAALDEFTTELSFSPDHVEAGNEVALSLALTNQSSQPLSRVRAVTEADLSLFDKREFLLGRVAPGETRRWTLPLTLPKNLEARQEKVVAELRDARGPLGRAEALLTISPRARPRFSMRYRLLDNGEMGSTGNGDGRPQPGETVVLRLTATNHGEGVSEKNVAIFKPEKGLEGVFVKVGRKELGSIAPGEDRSVNLVFRLQPDFVEGRLPAEVAVIDTVFRDGVTAKVDVGSSSGDVHFRPPTIAFAGDPPPVVSTREVLTLRGVVRDDRRVANVIVFVNGRKVFYQAGPARRAEQVAFDTEVKLKEGVNEIILVAHDDQKLVTRRVVVVRRDPAPALARHGTESSVARP